MMIKSNSLVGLLLVLTVGSGSHTLVFLSTGRWNSQAQLYFEQLTIFDNVTVSKCDGLSREEQFKPRLQKSALPNHCDEAYYNILESIYNIQDHTNNTVDIVQRRQGCSRAADGTKSAFEVWALNGKEFLTFNSKTLTWTSKSQSSLKIKKIWDKQLTRSHAFSAFLETFCPNMIQQMSVKSIHVNTELHVFAKTIEDSDELQLVCHVTTPDPSVKFVRLVGNGALRVVWVSVMGPLPSGEGSWILRLSARISLRLTDLTYGCAVQSENQTVTVYWDGTTLDGRFIHSSITYKILNAIIGFLAIIAFIFLISWSMIALLKIIKRRRLPPPPPPRPELREQFESFIQSSTLYPDIRSVLLSVLYGSNTPDRHHNSYNQWLEMAEHENSHDPDFHGGLWV